MQKQFCVFSSPLNAKASPLKALIVGVVGYPP